MSERDSLNELAQQLASEAGKKITNIPGIKAVCMTFVGDEEIPLGTFVYDDKHQDASTVLKAIERLSRHSILLVRALGRYERDHREGVGGQAEHEAEPDGHEPTHNTAPDAAGDETAQGADELLANPDR